MGSRDAANRAARCVQRSIMDSAPLSSREQRQGEVVRCAWAALEAGNFGSPSAALEILLHFVRISRGLVG